MTATLWLLLALAALIAGALLSSLHQSLRDVSRARLEELAAMRRRDALARRVRAILDDVPGHAAAVALPRVIANLVVVIAVVLWLTGLQGDTVAPTWVERLVGLLLSALLIWIFGVVFPLSVAEHAAERTVLAGSRLLRACHLAVAPFRRVIRVFDEIVRRLVGGERPSPADAREAELRSVVEEGEREGQFDETERDMIEAVVEFRSTTVEQIMTPRTEIDAVPYTDDVYEVMRTVEECGHSRIPVYRENLDHVVGILYARDLLKWFIASGGPDQNGRGFVLEDILRPAIFVPETKTVRELLTELLAAKVHIAMIADEYGGTSGLVTIEDIVEEIFGEIRDEYEEEEDGPESVRIDLEARTAEVDAREHIDDTNDELEPLGIELPESDDYDTVGGFVVVTLGRIPEPGESFRHGPALVSVLEAEPTRVTRIRLEVVEDPAAPPDEREPEGESDDTPDASDRRSAPAAARRDEA